MTKSIGVDLGGTKISTISLEKANPTTISTARRVATPRGTDLIISTIIEEIAMHREFQAIGIAVPGPIDQSSGAVKFCANIPGFEHVPLREILEHHFQVPVALENDANAQAFGESILGCGSGSTSSVFITISTGIGAGIVKNGKLWVGAHGIAGEVGHIVGLPHGPFTGAGIAGGFEALASGTALARDMRVVLGLSSEISDQAVIETGMKNLELVGSVCEIHAGHLAQLISNVQLMLDPEVIILGGGVMKNQAYFNHIRRVAEAALVGFVKPDIRMASLRESGAVGAALAALDLI